MADKKKQPLLPAYLIVGEDELKRRTVLERLRARTMQEGDIAFNHDQFDCERATGAQIVAACNTLPFASPVRLVEVAQIEKLKKADSDDIVSYLGRPCATTILALHGEKLNKNSRLYKAVQALGKSAVISCEPMKRYELEKAVRNMATGHGFTITAAAAARLVELVGEDTVRIDTELKKLALAHRGLDPVNNHEVEMLVSQTAEVKPWVFVNAFAARDMALCLKTYPLIEKRSPITLLSQCVARLRELACAKSLDRRGESARLAEVYNRPAWQFKNHVAHARRFSDKELVHAIVSARDCEQAMKTGADPEDAFIRWAMETMKR